MDLFPLENRSRERMMGTAAVRTLKPNVTQKELSGFLHAGLSALYWRMRVGPLQKIAEAYVPFWLYRVRYELGRSLTRGCSL